jgi:hypothetical protein
MRSILIILCTVIIGGINGHPFLFFPEHMLPPIGMTYNFTFDGLVSTWKISGIYAIQAVTSEDMKTIIGYRNWQLYTGELNATFYGVSYKNSTYPQALVNPKTQECENVFSEILNCTNWTPIDVIQWDSRCSIVRLNSSITGEMSLTIHASTSDLKRPLYFTGTTYISGSPMNMTVTYNFLSQTEEKNFPYIKCYF